MAVSEDEWRLYSGGQALGDQSGMDSRLSQGYESTGGRTVGDGSGNSSSTVRISLNRGQANTFDRYIQERNNADPKNYASVDSKYGVDINNYRTQFASKSTDQLYGYNPAGIGTVKQYYTGKFGTASGFAEGDELGGALDRVYGEIQGKQDLGKGWEELYQSVDRWKQQDRMWYESAVGSQDELFPKAIAHQKAQMAAGGMQEGTALWNDNVNKINNQRLDIEGTYEQKQQALKESQSYQALNNQYQDMKGTMSTRAKEATRTRISNEVITHEATTKWQGARYGRDSETGEQIVISEGRWIDTPAYDEVVSTPYEETYNQTTKTNDLEYGIDGAEPTFDEFYDQQFSGATNVDNPYVDRELSNQPESETDRRARLSASGQEME
jgi:hypothetical protein